MTLSDPVEFSPQTAAECYLFISADRLCVLNPDDAAKKCIYRKSECLSVIRPKIHSAKTKLTL